MARRRARRTARQLLIHEALLLALDRRTEVLEAVYDADDAFAARKGVQSLLNIGDEPAAAVLDMQMRRFTARDRQYLVDRVAELRALAT